MTPGHTQFRSQLRIEGVFVHRFGGLPPFRICPPSPPSHSDSPEIQLLTFQLHKTAAFCSNPISCVPRGLRSIHSQGKAGDSWVAPIFLPSREGCSPAPSHRSFFYIFPEFFFFFFFLLFLGPHPLHVEVPRLGVK